MEKTCVESSQSRAAQWLRYWFPVIAYVTLIFYLSSLSHPEERLPNFLFEQLGDKLLHGIEYAVLALLCYRAFRWAAGPQAGEYAVMLAIVATSLYGLTDELHQAYVPLRESSLADWIADTTGAVIGAVGSRRQAEQFVTSFSRNSIMPR
jgi:VanZ family protein